MDRFSICPKIVLNFHVSYLKWSFRIDTLCILVATTIIYKALVDVPAMNSIPGKSIHASAVEWALKQII